MAEFDNLSKKICTTCLVEQPMSDFYSKGSRTDSACKSCIKKKRQTTYVASKNQLSPDDIERLKQTLDLLAEFELKRLERIEKELDDVIARASHRV